MGLLDSVIGAIGGASGGASGGGSLGGGLGGGLQAGGRSALISLVLGMLMNRGQGAGGLGGLVGGLTGAGAAGGAGAGLGGLGDLIGRFQQRGMGDVVDSWVGTGQNLPVSPDQVQGVFGDDLMAQLAQRLGVSQGEAAGQVSEVLPEVVDTMTPNGELPPDGNFGDIGDILGRFSK